MIWECLEVTMASLAGAAAAQRQRRRRMGLSGGARTALITTSSLPLALRVHQARPLELGGAFPKGAAHADSSWRPASSSTSD